MTNKISRNWRNISVRDQYIDQILPFVTAKKYRSVTHFVEVAIVEKLLAEKALTKG